MTNSTLHSRLLDIAENGRPGDGVDDHEPRLYAAVKATLDLHKPDGIFCTVCFNAVEQELSWPCPTVEVVARALGVDVPA